MNARKLSLIFVGLVLAVLGMGLLTPASMAAPHGKTFNVNEIVDEPDAKPGDGKCETALGNNVCTLRAAIEEANALAGADTINLVKTTYTLARTGDDETAHDGDLDVTDDLTIVGGGVGETVIDGNGAVTFDRVFEIVSGSVTMSALTITKGMAQYGGGIIVEDGASLTLNSSAVTDNHAPGYTDSGGGIYNMGTLTVNYSTVGGNSAGGRGGAIVNRTTLTLLSSLVIYNSAAYSGGIDNDYDATATLTNSTIGSNQAIKESGGGIGNSGTLALYSSTVSKNKAGSSGGGIHNEGTLTTENSTISYNSALQKAYKNFGGGGLQNYRGTATLTNSTVSGNSAYLVGGGIANYSGTVELRNVTLTLNIADSDKDNSGAGGGISNSDITSVVSLSNSIVAGNWKGGVGVTAQDCSGTLKSQDYNLFQNVVGCNFSGTIAHNTITSNPKLGALLPNDGATFTHALLAGSPAIDAGDPTGCKDSNSVTLSNDQRGYVRPTGAACDIGAYEYDADPAPTPTNTPLPPTNTPTPTNLPPTPTMTPSPTNTPPSSCQDKPLKPSLLTPGNQTKVNKGKISLDWKDSKCADTYKVTIKKLVKNGDKRVRKLVQNATVSQSNYTTSKAFKKGKYFWGVQACDDAGCANSPTWKFKIKK